MEHDRITTDEKRRRDAGILQITERDILCLTWISEQFCIPFDQLRRLLGRQAKATTKHPDILSVSATRDTLQRWLQLGLIEPPRKIIGEHTPYIWLSRKGLSQLGLPYSYYEPRPGAIKHIYTTNSVRLALESYDLQSTWYSYRLLRRQSEYSPHPDAELRTRSFPLIAVRVIERPLLQPITLHDEVDRLTALATRQRDHSPYYATLWYFLHAGIVPTLREALATLDQQLQERVTLFGLDTQELDS